MSPVSIAISIILNNTSHAWIRLFISYYDNDLQTFLIGFHQRFSSWNKNSSPVHNLTANKIKMPTITICSGNSNNQNIEGLSTSIIFYLFVFRKVSFFSCSQPRLHFSFNFPLFFCLILFSFLLTLYLFWAMKKALIFYQLKLHKTWSFVYFISFSLCFAFT